jgi:hypothetical protein
MKTAFKLDLVSNESRRQAASHVIKPQVEGQPKSSQCVVMTVWKRSSSSATKSCHCVADSDQRADLEGNDSESP